jgi:MFS family permease
MFRDRSLSAAMAGPVPVTASGAARWGLMAVADFRRLWLIGFVVFSVRWLEMIVVGVFVYRQTGSAFDVTLMTLLRMLPMAMFGALIGAFAERIERRHALVAVNATMLTTAVCVAALAYAGRLAVWHLAVASFCNGLAWTADNPVRRVMIGEVVGHERMGRAMSIDVGANNASRMLGPTVGGLLLATWGIAGALTVSVLCYAVALGAALRVRHRNLMPTVGGPGAVLARMIEGLVLVRRDPRLVGTLAVTVIYNVFGWPFTSLIPVIGQDHLHLGAGGIGMLASMDGIGAFCGVLALAVYAQARYFSRLYLGSVVSYLSLLIVFSIMPNAPLAGAVLLLTGVSNAAFSVMQATLIYLAAPAEMRSRLYGVLSVCIGSSPIGFFYIGVLADAVGAPAATAATGILGLVALAASWRWWRLLLTAIPAP